MKQEYRHKNDAGKKPLSSTPMLVTVEFPAELVERLSRLATMQGKTPEATVNEVVSEAVEDIADRLIGEDVMKRIKSGKEQTYSAKEVCNVFGLGD